MIHKFKQQRYVVEYIKNGIYFEQTRVLLLRRHDGDIWHRGSVRQPQIQTTQQGCHHRPVQVHQKS